MLYVFWLFVVVRELQTDETVSKELSVQRKRKAVMRQFLVATLVALTPALLKAEAVFIDGVTDLTNERVLQLAIPSNENENVVIRFSLKVEDNESHVTLSNSSLMHVYFADDYRTDTKTLWFRSSTMEKPMNTVWDTGLHILSLDRVLVPGEGSQKTDCMIISVMIGGEKLVLQIPKDEKNYTFDLTSDAVVDAKQIFLAKAKHLVRLAEQEAEAEQEMKDHKAQVNLIINAGSSAAMAKLKRSSRKPSKTYAERVAPNLAKKSGYSGADVTYFVSGFLKTMGY